MPTPLHRLENLSEHLGCEIWAKRDDMTGLALGGNKARKLAYLVSEAADANCDVLVTAGGAQSNHARMTAAASRIAGLDCHLVLGGPEDRSGNVLLDTIFGATIHWAESDAWQDVTARLDEVTSRLTEAGRRPMQIPLGGATATGSLGYVDAASELATQIAAVKIDRARVVFASGTGGTHAGLLAGAASISAHTDLGSRPARHAELDIHAVAVAQPEELPGIVADLASKTAQSCGAADSWLPEQIHVDARYWGGQYGVPTQEALSAIELFATVEGILLDPVYTGKAAAGLIDMCKNGEIDRREVTVFLHTGGAPALFARQFASAVAPREVPS